MAIFGGLSKHFNFGLLLLRIGLGFMMIMHGYPKLFGGVEKWTAVGGAMKNLGIHDFPHFWGFMAAFAETIGGLLFMLGFLFRPAAFLLLFTMIVAAVLHLSNGEGLMGASHPIEAAVVFLAMFIIGPGKYSVDRR